MKVSKSRKGEVHAVMGIDPGGTTGLYACHVKLDTMLKSTLLRGIQMSKCIEVKGDWRSQAHELADIVTRFLFTAQVERSIPAQNVHIAVEDYQRRPTARSTNLTSVWVAAGMCMALPPEVYDHVTWQQPSDAMNLATNARLRMWEMWQVGSDHKRDATRHAILAIDKLLC